ncbi:TonB-dependent receptor [Sphingorhabdus contaminans]|uniref:TonB-dependent receptor n=1 Tax=Sphingorhabdus contaminans TaxID=1343899 RepID=UPI003D2D1FC4
MKRALLFGLPLWMAATPLWAQDCQLPVRDENDQAHYGCRRANDVQVPVAITALTDAEILVVGTLADPRSDSAYPVTRIDVADHPGARLETALQQAAGLQQFRRSDARTANPTSQGITLRGLGGNASSRVLLLLDDVPQADPFGGWVSWPGYDALNLARITVRRGAGQVTSGAGALGGVVELDSLQYRDLLSGRLAYGSRDSVDAKASVLRKLGTGSTSLSGSYARGDGFVPVVKGQRGAVDRAAPYEQAGLALRAVAPVSDNTELQANMRAFTDDRDRGFDFSDSQNRGVDASLRLVNRTVAGWQWSALGYVQIRDFANRFGAIAAGRNSVALTLDQYSVPSTGLGARIEVRPPLGDKAELRLGSDWRRTSGETHENFFFTGLVPGRSRRAGGQSDTIGFFAEGSYTPNDNLTLTLGGRADRWKITNGFRKEVNIGGTVRSDDVFADRSGWEGTGRGSVALYVNNSVKLRGAAYAGWRLPTLNELYRPFRVGADATAANELLAPEKVQGVEIGADIETDALSLRATAFANRLKNAIANVGLGIGPGNFLGVGFVAAGGVYRQRQNLDAIASKGVELEFDYRSGPYAFGARYAYVDAEVDASGTAALLDGLRPAQVPRHFASASVAYDADAFRAEVDVRYVGGQFEDDINSRGLDDALTVDAGFSYRLLDKLRLELRGENLFDRRVEAAIGSDGVIERATPRTIWAGIAVEF